MTLREVQAALLSLGYKLPRFGADGFWGGETRDAMNAFQRDRGLTVTARENATTIAALQAALTAKAEIRPSNIVPADWMPAAQMKRIIVHWTAGNHKASADDRKHYHLLIEGGGNLVRGAPSIALNDARGAKAGYAAHTLNCNTGSIGVSLCCMAGAIERPFNPGRAPLTETQWMVLPQVLAELCRRYDIPVTPQTVLSHAEVQGTLRIAQKGKWDISRLAFDLSVVGARACGDIFRAATRRLHQS